MKFENFKSLFHESWHLKMRPFIESEACDKIYEFLKKETKRGKKIAPLSSNVYNCFLQTPLNNMCAVLMGLSPYHTTINDIIIADGLLMGCSNTKKLQPSLQQFYDAIERELFDGLMFGAVKSPDVTYLAKQGILMFNASLTTEINKAGSHFDLWQPFTKYVFEEIIAYTGVPVVFLGEKSSMYKKYMPPFSWSFAISHPASASYSHMEWDTEGTFGKVAKIVKDNNNIDIQWIQDFTKEINYER